MAKEYVCEEDNEQNLIQARDRVYFKNGMRGAIKILIKAAFKIFPPAKCWIKREAVNTTYGWFPPTDAFLWKKHVKVYNLLKHTYVVRDYEYTTEQLLKKEFRQKLRQVERNYDSLKEDYERNYPRLTSYEFWKQYLHLDKE